MCMMRRASTVGIDMIALPAIPTATNRPGCTDDIEYTCSYSIAYGKAE